MITAAFRKFTPNITTYDAQSLHKKPDVNQGWLQDVKNT